MELHLYDFDGTLFRAPDRPEWWGPKSWVVNPVSLGPPCVPEKPGPEWWVPSAVSDAKRSIANPDVWAILCTGRAKNSGMRYRVPELLKQKGLRFDEVFLNSGEDTKAYKIKVIAKLLREFPGIDTVQIWENHLPNMAAFCKFVESTGRVCIEHPVKVPKASPICTENEVETLEAEGWKVRGASTTGLCVLDPMTGWSFSHNGSRAVPLASVMKIPLMVEVFRRIDAGLLNLDDMLPLTLADQSYSGALLALPHGKRLSVRELLYWMITDSDNQATDMLWRRVGLASVNRTMRQLGYDSINCTILMRTSFLIEAGLGTGWVSLPPEQRLAAWRGMSPSEQETALQIVWQENAGVPGERLRDALALAGGPFCRAIEQESDNKGSPEDIARLLLGIVQGQVASRASCDHMLRLLRDQKSRGRIPAGISDGSPVGNKTGTISGTCNDAAVIWPKGGAPYVMVVLVSGLDDSQEEEAPRGIAQLAGVLHAAALQKRSAQRVANRWLRQGAYDPTSWYYDGEPGLDLQTVLDRWQEHEPRQKLYDHAMPLMLSLREIWPLREYTWTRDKARSGFAKVKGKSVELPGPLKWDAIMEDMKQRGWDQNDPLVLNVGHEGVKVGEGNHRLAIAKKLGISKVPVSFWFISGRVSKSPQHEKPIEVSPKAIEKVVEKKREKPMTPEETERVDSIMRLLGLR